MSNGVLIDAKFHADSQHTGRFYMHKGSIDVLVDVIVYDYLCSNLL